MSTRDPIEPTQISAGRLHLRPWQPEDVPATVAACQDPQIARWTNVPQPCTEASARAWVEHRAPAAWAGGTGAPFAVLEAVDGRLVGSCSLTRVEGGAAEVGFWTAPGERGRGVATEALGAVCRWGFGALGLERLTWLSYAGNAASLRVADKVGFVLEGTLRGYLLQRGRRRDAWIAGLLPTDLR